MAAPDQKKTTVAKTEPQQAASEGFQLSLETSIDQAIPEEPAPTTQGSNNNLNSLIKDAFVKVAENAPKTRTPIAPIYAERGTPVTSANASQPQWNRSHQHPLSVGNVAGFNLPGFGTIIQWLFVSAIGVGLILLILKPTWRKSLISDFGKARMTLDRGSQRSLDVNKALKETFQNFGKQATVSSPEEIKPVSEKIDSTSISPSAEITSAPMAREKNPAITAYLMRDEARLKSMVETEKCSTSVLGCTATILYASIQRDSSAMRNAISTLKTTDPKTLQDPMVRQSLLYASARLASLEDDHKRALFEAIGLSRSTTNIDFKRMASELAATESLFLNDSTHIDVILNSLSSSLSELTSDEKSKTLLISAFLKSSDAQKFAQLLAVPQLRTLTLTDTDLLNAALRTAILRDYHPVPDLFGQEVLQKSNKLKAVSPNASIDLSLVHLAYLILENRTEPSLAVFENLFATKMTQIQLGRLSALVLAAYFKSPEKFRAHGMKFWGNFNQSLPTASASGIFRKAMLASVVGNPQEALNLIDRLSAQKEHPYVRYWTSVLTLHTSTQAKPNQETLNAVNLFLEKNPQSVIAIQLKLSILQKLRRPVTIEAFVQELKKQKLDFDNQLLYENQSGPFSIASSL